MLADTSEICDFSHAQHRYAADLAALGRQLAAARVSVDAFGSVGTHFLAAFNAALLQQAQHVAQIADRLAEAGSTTWKAAKAYEDAESTARQTLSVQGG